MSEILDPRSSWVAGELACGVIGPDGQLLDTFLAAGLTGREEDLLTGSGNVATITTAVLCNCIRQIGGEQLPPEQLARAIKACSDTDRGIMMVGIRRATFGDSYPVRVACPGCGKETDFEVDLSTLKVVKSTDPGGRVTTTLPSGTVVKWHALNALDEIWASANQELYQKQRATMGFVVRVDEIDGVAVSKYREPDKLFDRIVGMPVKDRAFWRGLFEKVSGELDRRLEFDCPDRDECGRHFQYELEMRADIFFALQG